MRLVLVLLLRICERHSVSTDEADHLICLSQSRGQIVLLPTMHHRSHHNGLRRERQAIEGGPGGAPPHAPRVGDDHGGPALCKRPDGQMHADLSTCSLVPRDERRLERRPLPERERARHQSPRSRTRRHERAPRHQAVAELSMRPAAHAQADRMEGRGVRGPRVERDADLLVCLEAAAVVADDVEDKPLLSERIPAEEGAYDGAIGVPRGHELLCAPERMHLVDMRDPALPRTAQLRVHQGGEAAHRRQVLCMDERCDARPCTQAEPHQAVPCVLSSACLDAPSRCSLEAPCGIELCKAAQRLP